ncbi:Na+/H+ antiporter [Nocardioides insulae]|uniref:Na+/H+ antiporter n=1 Tax=Nocardioides insulae TaxID=394734 RepID=UPI000410B5D4|nr:Na+/H+ antiporter [Nocardioides insulae]
MEIALLLVGLAVGVLVCTAVAERLEIPAPFILIPVGVAASYAPPVPQIYLHEQVVLLGLLPPLLYAAAVQTSLIDITAHKRPILWLSVGLVVITTVAVGVIAHWLLPGLSWAMALAIGAVVAPPDAIAATAIGRRIGLPRRVVTILEGESLFNDATALVSLRVALGLAAGHAVDAWEVGLDFVIAAGGGVLVGVGVYLVVAWGRRLLRDRVLETAVSLVVPFVAYLAAEEMEASGVIAVVVAGLLLGHRAPVLQSAESRIAERLNWETISFVLENLVFLLIGLQAWWIVEGALDSGLSVGHLVLVCTATLGLVIVVRLAYLFVFRLAISRPDPLTGQKTPWRHTLLIGWAGMRGVVTLAAAFLIPDDAPYREVMLLMAFTVVAGTLFLQGMSLPWLARRLRVPAPDPAADALARANLLQQAAQAAEAELETMEFEDPHGVRDLVRRRLQERTFAAWERLSTTPGEESPSELYNRIRLELLGVERSKVLEIRGTRAAPASVIADVLATFDVEESMLDVATEERKGLRVTREEHRPGDGCEDLGRHPPIETDPDAVCAECVAEGRPWISLRQCLTCGHVGCCDSSVRQDATRHFRETGHPVIQSAEVGEDWRWCYLHNITG